MVLISSLLWKLHSLIFYRHIGVHILNLPRQWGGFNVPVVLILNNFNFLINTVTKIKIIFQGSIKPDIELEITFLDPTDTYKKTFYYNDETWDAIWNGTDSSKVFTIQTILLFPESTGTVRLKSNDPYDYPLVDPRYVVLVFLQYY